MNEEIMKDMKDSMKKRRFIQKIKYKFKLWSISDKDIHEKRRILIDEAKPVFEEFSLKTGKKDLINVLSIKWFDKRIMSLPKYYILELHEQLQKIKDAKSKEAKSYFLHNFLINLTLSYSLHGWFIKNLFYYIRTGKS